MEIRKGNDYWCENCDAKHCVIIFKVWATVKSSTKLDTIGDMVRVEYGLCENCLNAELK